MTTKQNLVLLPGLLCDAAMWQHQQRHLIELADITVADFTLHDSIAGMAEEELRKAPARFALAGLSMGGYVALEIIRRAPERVSKLALLDTSARADTAEKTEQRKEVIRLCSTGKYREVISQMLPLIMHPNRMQDRQLIDAVTGMAERVGSEVFAHRQRAIMSRPDSRNDLNRIQCPTIVLCGRQDTLTTLEAHEEMASNITHAHLSIIEDCAHISSMEQPQAVTALLREWLLYR